MTPTRFLSRAADFIVGIPLMAAGLYAIWLDVQSMIWIARGKHVLWAIGAGTIIGILPLALGTWFVFRFRRRPPVKTSAPNPDAPPESD